jgi:hypothetical protein
MVTVKCKKNSYEESKGIIRKRVEVKKMEGITVGKEYCAFPVSKVSGETANGYGDVSTKIRFLVFDDTDMWAMYPTDFFVPVKD